MSDAPLVLGTAGHIDHGKTALVRALTGVDTDRLPEERARGITIDLGFAELVGPDGLRMGVVDVPGHEDFVRTMVAGATGMDVVLLVIAADEGVMPQTREHLDIVRVLEVPELVVALTKCDLVEEEWLGLVEEDVRALLEGGRHVTAPIVRTSATREEGLEALLVTLASVAKRTRSRRSDDIVRMPVDRVFTVQGTGTVVTGTLWSGSLAVGDRVRIAPGHEEARVRTLQVHGRPVEAARAGERTAVALAGLDRAEAQRGDTLVAPGGWPESRMLTVLASVLAGGRWTLEHGQRVRVLLGTSEVLARCALLEDAPLRPGDAGWVQLRLEAPLVARTGDRVVLRSYSPVTTVGGGVVAEPLPPKRKRLDAAERALLDDAVSAEAGDRAVAAVELAGWGGAPAPELPVRAGAPAAEVSRALEGRVLTARERLFSMAVADEGRRLVERALDEGHGEDPLSPSVSLERLRGAVPPWSGPGLADALVRALVADGRVELAEGGARRPGFEPSPTPAEAAALKRLAEIYREAGLGAPFVDELPSDLGTPQGVARLLAYLERSGRLRTVDAGLLVDVGALVAAERAVVEELGGREGLGPADFRAVLPVSRRHLMPLLSYLDGIGVTVRDGGMRRVRG